MRTPTLVVALALLAGTAGARAEELWVDDDCTDPATGSEAQPYCTIQQAICLLRDGGGGTVRVRPGHYNESLRMFPGVSVVSTDGPTETTIDATGRLCTTSQCTVIDPDITSRCAVVVWGQGSPNSDRLEGFRITGGAGLKRVFNDGSEAQVGGGVFVYNSSPTITNNVIVDNTLFSKTTHNFWGGGIYLGGGSYANPTYPVITHNVIESNSSTPTVGDVIATVPGSEAVGGGIYVGLFTSPTIQANVIRNNVAGDEFTELGVGGGIASYAIASSRQPQISRNVIQANLATELGGGVFFGRVVDGIADFPTRGTLTSNLIEQNQGDGGGGVLTNTTLLEIRNNTIVDNVAELGGGIALYSSQSNEPTLIDNVIAYNVATTDDGGGVAFFTTPNTVNGNDVFGNSPDQIGGTHIDADYIGIDGNISVAPNFRNRAPGVRDLSPGPGSPLIDRGQPTSFLALDLFGTPRVLDGDGDGVATIDIGAIEFAPDSDADGVPDFADNCPEAPNATQDDLDGDAIGSACDLDDDNDGIDDASDPEPLDPFRCGDFDGDGCDDCTSGTLDAANDGDDFDADGLCDAGDRDDDNDGIRDALDAAPHDPLICADADGDTCDDCASGFVDTTNDGTDFDGDGRCDAGDSDDDNDGVDDLRDCADHAPGVTTLPGSVGASLRFGAGALLSWKRSPQATVYNVFRGTLAPGSFDWNVTCRAANVLTARNADPAVPLPGTAFFYVVAARNVCGDGPVLDSPATTLPFATGVCAVSDDDSDGDGILDLSDNCPLVPGADPRDTDADGLGDRCDPCPWGERPAGGCQAPPTGGEPGRDPTDLDAAGGMDVKRD